MHDPYRSRFVPCGPGCRVCDGCSRSYRSGRPTKAVTLLPDAASATQGAAMSHNGRFDADYHGGARAALIHEPDRRTSEVDNRPDRAPDNPAPVGRVSSVGSASAPIPTQARIKANCTTPPSHITGAGKGRAAMYRRARRPRPQARSHRRRAHTVHKGAAGSVTAAANPRRRGELRLARSRPCWRERHPPHRQGQLARFSLPRGKDGHLREDTGIPVKTALLLYTRRDTPHWLMPEPSCLSAAGLLLNHLRRTLRVRAHEYSVGSAWKSNRDTGPPARGRRPVGVGSNQPDWRRPRGQ